MLLQVRIGSKPKDDYAGSGIWGCLYDTFKWDYDCAKSTQFFDLGNNSKGKLDFEFLPLALDFEQVEEADAVVVADVEAKVYDVRGSLKKLPVVYDASEEQEFISYSKLEGIERHEALDVDVCDVEESDANNTKDFGSDVHLFLERAVMCSEFKIDELENGRLESAVRFVLGAQEFKNILEFEMVTPEMEFCVPIEICGEIKFLRGQMDLVGVQQEEAYVIDYKTGRKPIDHTLQAKVYAYALLKAGLEMVKLDFVHAEIPGCVQSFVFHKSDVDELKLLIEKAAAKLHICEH